RTENERSAAIIIKTLTSSEADFRQHDKDGNGVQDFWTGDVAGLFRFGCIADGLANADAAPLVPHGPAPVPLHGYYYKALRMDLSIFPPQHYAMDTDQETGKVHNEERFGFVAYPENPGVSGNFMFLVNEYNSVLRARADIPVPDDFPSDEELKKH